MFLQDSELRIPHLLLDEYQLQPGSVGQELTAWSWDRSEAPRSGRLSAGSAGWEPGPTRGGLESEAADTVAAADAGPSAALQPSQGITPVYSAQEEDVASERSDSQAVAKASRERG